MRTNYRKVWSDHYGPIPKDEKGRSYEIHHIDGNHDNNDISNLKAVSIEEHYQIHYDQGDWGACSMISTKLNLSLEDLNEIYKKIGSSQKGRVFSEETRKKMSEAKRNTKLSEDHKRRIGDSHKGKKRSEETKRRISEAHIGKKRSEESRRSMREAKKYLSDQSRKNISEAKKGEKHPNYGKNRSEETKRRIREALKKRYGK